MPVAGVLQIAPRVFDECRATPYADHYVVQRKYPPTSGDVFLVRSLIS